MAQQKRKATAFYWGFPVSRDEPSDQEAAASPAKPQGSRGVAMLIAIMVIAMMLVFVADMIINATVNLQLASGSRDRMKAEYLAKSGLNLSIFLIMADWGLDLATFQGLTGQKTVPTDGDGDPWSMLNGLPIGGGTLEMLSATQEKFNLNKVADSGVMDQLQLFDGQFTIDVEDETSRINLNSCLYGRAETCLEMLTALFSCPAEKEMFSRKKIIPKVMAGNIKDWIDLDKLPTKDYAEGNNEDDQYDNRQPKSRPKNAPFDSIDELKVVEGWNDEFHTVFKDFLTIYPIPNNKDVKSPINLNTAKRELLSCLLPEATKQCAEKSIRATNPAKDEDKLEAVNSREAIGKRLNDYFCETDKKKQEFFTTRTDLFRVKITGSVRDQERTLQVIVSREMPSAEDKKNNFLSTYKVLDWKML